MSCHSVQAFTFAVPILVRGAATATEAAAVLEVALRELSSSLDYGIPGIPWECDLEWPAVDPATAVQV